MKLSFVTARDSSDTGWACVVPSVAPLSSRLYADVEARMRMFGSSGFCLGGESFVHVELSLRSQRKVRVKSRINLTQDTRLQQAVTYSDGKIVKKV